MIKIYHAIHPNFNETFDNWKDYELVAEVNTDNIEKAFELTNSIHGPWWENEGVKCIKKTRSTSVGDIAEVNGQYFQCGYLGWKDITDAINKNG